MYGVFLSNLPTNITNDKLSSILRKELPEDDGNFMLTLYDSPDGIRRTATVTGFKSSLQKVIIPSLMNIVFKNDYKKDLKLRVKLDRGDKRDQFGSFVKPICGLEKLALFELTGKSTKKAIAIFDSTLLESIRPVTQLRSATVYAYLNGVKPEDLSSNNGIQSISDMKFEKEPGRTFYRLTYKSILDLLHGMSMFNNKELSSGVIRFTDQTGKHLSSLNRQSGITAENNVISNFHDAQLNHGYIPFGMLDKNILNSNAIQDLKSKCWKCHSNGRISTYSLLGINADLNFLAGVCRCDYEQDLPVLDSLRPFMFPNEKFTRLVNERDVNNRKDGVLDLIVQHEPMKQSYNSPTDYCNVVLPILFDEWKTFSTNFKAENTCINASVGSFAKIQTLESGFGHKQDLFFIELLAPNSGIWKKDRSNGIKNLTITLDVISKQRETTRHEVRKAKVVYIDTMVDGFAHVYARVILPHLWQPSIQDNVRVIPKPIKLDYNNTIHTLKGWAKGKIHAEELNIILRADAPSLPKINGVSGKILFGPLHKRRTDSFQKLKSTLNAEQLAAYDIAKTSMVSVVQGPPGTGKTHWIAATAILLHLIETGVILACASSNEAANGIALKIKEVSTKNNIPLRVCRVFSKSNEKHFLRTKQNPMENSSVHCLHMEVRKALESELSGTKFKDIRRKVLEEDQYHLLTESQIAQLEKIIAKLEQDHFGKYDVIVATTGTLSDHRISSWNKPTKITSVFVDEVGQTKQTELPFVFTFGQKRTCLVGDHKQLKPLVHSLAADNAGLNKSCMEWLDESGKNVPWTLLKEQHRMAPSIRDLTSHLTYNDEMRDADYIKSRESKIHPSLYLKNPYLENHDLIVFQHNGNEKKIASSYINEKEAVIVTQLVQNLIDGGLLHDHVTILTFYEAQKSLISNKLRDNNLEDVDVKNVDAFQGKENSIIILSLSRSNSNNEYGFTRIQNRINVAVSRAMFKLIVVCNFNFYANSKVSIVQKLATKLRETAKFINPNY